MRQLMQHTPAQLVATVRSENGIGAVYRHHILTELSYKKAYVHRTQILPPKYPPFGQCSPFFGDQHLPTSAAYPRKAMSGFVCFWKS